MGSGIVEVCARSGYPVVVSEINEELLNKGLGMIKASLARGVQKGKVSKEDEQATLGRIKGTTEIKDFADCDIVIEAILENMDAKRNLFGSLDEICPKQTIFASNTSALSITEMASATKRLERVIGFHFFNPVPVMRLIEVVRTLFSDEEVINTAKEFGKSIGKQAVLADDRPGFIVNRILVQSLREAIKLMEEGISKEDIDTAMKLGANWPMGPLELLDFLGLDVGYDMWSALYKEYMDPIWAPPLILKQMVLAGRHGRKTGKGFYDYK
jgi:3-hydroxybutyryl-CoA dehydrogenase